MVYVPARQESTFRGLPIRHSGAPLGPMVLARACFDPAHPRIGRAVQLMANLFGRFAQIFDKNYKIGASREFARDYILSRQRIPVRGAWYGYAKPELIVPEPKARVQSGPILFAGDTLRDLRKSKIGLAFAASNGDVLRRQERLTPTLFERLRGLLS